jgi:flagellar protein FliO/FliZ
MFEGLFGAETPLTVRFFIAFAVVFALIGVAAWLVRRFGADRLRGKSMRNRQPRLGVIEASTVDGRRRLVLIRRDNVEHLLMIGGPTDVVIEPNIVRAQGNAGRELTASRGIPNDIVPRPVPLGEPSAWPLQPEPAAPRPARPVTAEDNVPWLQPAQPEIGRRRAPESLAGLTGELSRPSAPATDGGTHPRQVPPVDAPRVDTPRGGVRPTAPAPAIATADQNLADMAHRLEAALRRPGNSGERPAKEKSAPSPSAAPQAGAPPAPAGGDKAKQPGGYDSLEQEMASLLGRQPVKQ